MTHAVNDAYSYTQFDVKERLHILALIKRKRELAKANKGMGLPQERLSELAALEWVLEVLSELEDDND